MSQIKHAIVGILSNPIQAEAVVDELRISGFSSADVSALFPDATGHHEFAHVKSSKAPEGAVVGASAGGVLGAIGGWMLGIGVLSLPGTGAFLAAGPIFSALSSAAVCATAGGLSGALAGFGFPEYEARLYAGKLRDGNILVAAHADNSHAEKVARKIFERAGAHEIAITAEAPLPA